MSLASSSSRRGFLQVLGAGVLVASCDGEGVAKPTGRFQVGTKNDLPMAGSFKVSDAQAVVVFRDANGLYAMTMVCTHEQCDIRMSGKVTATEITCECHGSKFDANGAVTAAPAKSPLEHFKVELAMTGEIFVDADVTVPEATRVALV